MNDATSALSAGAKGALPTHSWSRQRLTMN
jgi:hypothetical protein